MKKFTKILFLFCLTFGFLFLFSSSANASTLFYDYFDTPNYEKWSVVGSPGWTISDGKYKIALNSGLSNSVASDGFWNMGWKDFIYNVDLYGVAGTDKNILLRFQDANNWYGIHHTYGSIYFEKVIDGHQIIVTPPIPFPLDNFVTYHLSTTFSGRRITFSVNNTTIFDFIDPDPALEAGKIGLRAGVGGVPVTEVWFDNVEVKSLGWEPTSTPTPTPASTIPVVFLPGLGASFSFKAMFLGVDNADDWQMTPGAKVYQNIMQAFADYPQFYVFYYDWRQSALANANKLHDFIKDQVKPPDNKVFLIGHSLGGLVSRVCVQTTADHCYAEKLITVGSPHSGAVQAYPVVEAGEIWGNNIVDMGLELLLHYYARPGETRRETAARVAPVMLELLPTFNFLKRNNVLLPWVGLAYKNPLLPTLNDLNPLKNITSTLFGQTFDTYGSLSVTDPSWWEKILGLWPDGKPVKKFYENGDATVLAKSGVINDPEIEQFSFDFDHSRIISDPLSLEKIFQILDLSFPATTFSPTSDEKDYLIFFVRSPVELSTPDAQADSFINPEMIIIPHPSSKNYTLNLKGLADGFYSLSVGQFFNNQVVWHDYFGEAAAGQTKSLVFDIDPTKTPADPLLDQNGQQTQFFLKATIKEFKEEVTAKRKILWEFLNKIQNAKDYEKALNFLTSLRLTLAEMEKQKLLSVDLANTFRKKSGLIGSELEYLLFMQPKSTTKGRAFGLINAAQAVKKSLKQNQLSKSGALVFMEAETKLAGSQKYFAAGKYYQAKTFATEARNLFLEAKILVAK